MRSIRGGADPADIDDLIYYLERNPMRSVSMTGKFVERHNYKDLYDRIFYSKEAKRFYVLYENHKVYMKKGWTKKDSAKYFAHLFIDQDKESAHCYRMDEMKFKGDEIVVDAGSAEGFFAVYVLDKVKKVYAFECDTEWLDSLKWTFKDTNKVVVVPKGLGGKVSDGITILDEYFKGEKIDLIKADIEGSECDTVRGGAKTLRNAKHAVFCTYHRENDAHDLKQLFEELGFQTELSKGGCIWFGFHYTELKPPYIRHGVIYATKN